MQEGESFLLLPQSACIGITKETVSLAPGACLSRCFDSPLGLCALLEGRSRFARLGLSVHITASFINPGMSPFSLNWKRLNYSCAGISNQQVLEIFNASNHPLALIPGTIVTMALRISGCLLVGTRLCQMVFLRMSGESTYSGIFQGKKNEL